MIPLVMSMVLTGFFGRTKSWRAGLKIWKFAIFAGLSFTLPAWIVNFFIGPEFPSIIGGLVGMMIVIPAAKRGFLIPKETWDDFSGQEQGTSTQETSSLKLSTLSAWSPYLLMALLLVLSRTIEPFKTFLNSWTINTGDILGTGITSAVTPLYLPGTFFIFVSLLALFLHKMPAKKLITAAGTSAYTLLPTVISLGASIPMVRLFLNSGTNTANLSAMPVELANLMANTLGSAWSFVAPVLGAFGSFISGSATFSNMMFSSLQFTAAETVGMRPELTLGLQMIGANAGNMMCVMNVVAAATVVGMAGQESDIIRKTLPIALGYCLLAGVVASLIQI